MQLNRIFTTIALTFAFSTNAFAESALVRTLESVKDTMIAVKAELKPDDVRRGLLDFLHKDLTDGIRDIRNEVNENPQLARQNYPRGNNKINRALEKILGSAFVNAHADQLLSNTVIFENASKNLNDRVEIVRGQLEPIRDLYFSEAQISFYRKYAFVRFSLRGFNLIRENASKALENSRSLDSVKSASENLATKMDLGIDRLSRLKDSKKASDIVEELKNGLLNSQSWNVLNQNLKNISVSDGVEIEGSYQSVVNTQFYFELLRNIWEKQI